MSLLGGGMTKQTDFLRDKLVPMVLVGWLFQAEKEALA